MRIQFLGTGDAFCSGGRYQTCFHVQMPDYQFLIDCGATSLKALKENQIRTLDIDAVIISHFHGDHFGGLPYFLLDANFIGRRQKALTILGPPEVGDRVEALTRIAYPGLSIKDFSFPVKFMEYQSGKCKLGPLEVEAFPVIHAEEALPYGVRIHGEGKILSFSGDSGWTSNLYDIAHLADLFICECNFFQTIHATHLNYPTIMSEQNNFTCKRIILNHLGPEMLANLSKCELTCAHDGLIVSI